MFGTYGSATLDANMGTQFRPFRGDEFSLAVVFGIVFPSCTGVMSGVNMSGDLANAQHSIPRGTAAGYAFAIAHIFHAFRTPGVSWAGKTVFGRPCHCLLALDSGLGLVGTVLSRR